MKLSLGYSYVWKGLHEILIHQPMKILCSRQGCTTTHIEDIILQHLYTQVRASMIRWLEAILRFINILSFYLMQDVLLSVSAKLLWTCWITPSHKDLIFWIEGAGTRRQMQRDRSGSMTLQALLHTMIKRQEDVYFSIVRRSADCASEMSSHVDTLVRQRSDQ